MDLIIEYSPQLKYKLFNVYFDFHHKFNEDLNEAKGQRKCFKLMDWSVLKLRTNTDSVPAFDKIEIFAHILTKLDRFCLKNYGKRIFIPKNPMVLVSIQFLKSWRKTDLELCAYNFANSVMIFVKKRGVCERSMQTNYGPCFMVS